MKIPFTINERTSTPVYIQIKEQIRNYILGQSLPGGTILPNVEMIANAAGVSIRTADLGLRELIKDGICYRRPKKGTFVSENAGVSARRKLICVIHPDGMMNNTHLANQGLYQGMLEEAKSNTTDLLLSTAAVEDNLKFYSQCSDILLQGVILTENCPLDLAGNLATQYPSLRFVYANYYFKNFEESASNICGVFNDDFGGAYQLASAMAEKGHEKFALCSMYVQDENYRQRMKGFLAGLASNGLKVRPDMILSGENESLRNHYQLGRTYAERLFSGNTEAPDAIMTVNDMISRGIIDFLRENRPSSRVEVTGYDYIDPEARSNTRFPSVSIDFERIGRKAVEIISRKNEAYPKTLRITPQIIL